MLKILEGTTRGYVLKKSNDLHYICNECFRNCIDNPGRIKRFILSIKNSLKSLVMNAIIDAMIMEVIIIIGKSDINTIIFRDQTYL
jgi:hypothetical protein